MGTQYCEDTLLWGHFVINRTLCYGDTSLGRHFIVMTLDYEDTSLVRLLVMGTYVCECRNVSQTNLILILG